MKLIKRVAEQAEGLTVVPLPSTVEPDRDQCEERQSLLRKKYRFAEQDKFVLQSSKELQIDIGEGK